MPCKMMVGVFKNGSTLRLMQTMTNEWTDTLFVLRFSDLLNQQK